MSKQLKKNTKPNWLPSLNDIQSQLEHLIYEDFIYYTPIEYLNSYPRYLQAIQQRLNKLQQTAERDRQYTNMLSTYTSILFSQPIGGCWKSIAFHFLHKA